MTTLKAKRTPQLKCPVVLKAIKAFVRRCLKAVETEPVTEEELVIIAKALKENKAQGPDSIPNNAMKLAIKTVPLGFKEIVDTCLAEVFFPKECKIQKLVLFSRGKKPPGQPSSYRPICLLDTIGKVLERIIYTSYYVSWRNRQLIRHAI